MKTIRKQLTDSITIIEEKIADREITFDDRSEKWQESENGERHQEKTDKLNEILDNLQMTLESIDDLLD